MDSKRQKKGEQVMSKRKGRKMDKIIIVLSYAVDVQVPPVPFCS